MPFGSFVSGRLSHHDRRWGPLASAWQDGELSADEARGFRAHAESCARCEARLSRYQALDSRLVSAGRAVAVPQARAVFDAAAGGGRRSRSAPRGLAVGLSAIALLLVLAVAAPLLRNLFDQRSSPRESFAGNRAVFQAPVGSAIVAAVHQYGLYAAPADGAAPQLIAQLPGANGRLFALAGGRVLYDSGSGPASTWTIANADGSDAKVLTELAGLDVLDVSSNGERVLLRRPSGDGGYSRGMGDSDVIDSTGAVIWSDVGAWDVYTLSPDGRFVLSATPPGLWKVPVDGTPSPPPIPLDSHPARRPQFSEDGGRVAMLVNKLGANVDGWGLAYTTANPFKLDPIVPADDGANTVFRLSPSGTRLATTLGSAGKYSVAVVRWGDGAPTPRPIPNLSADGVSALQWSPDGNRLLILLTRFGQQQAWVWNDQASQLRQVSATADVATAAWRPGSTDLLVLADPAGPAVLTPGSSSVQPLLSGDLAGVQPVYGPGGHVVLLSGDGPPNVLVRNGQQPAELSQAAQSFSFAPDGKRAVFVAAGQVFLWDETTGAGTAPIATGTLALWSPARGSDRIAIAGDVGALTIVDSSGRTVATPPDAMPLTSPAWSPDGRTLATVANDQGQSVLTLWDVSSGRMAQSVRRGGFGVPVWSPDGRKLAMAAAKNGTPGDELLVIDVAAARSNAGNSSAAIADLASLDGDLVWQADNNRVWFVDRATTGDAGPVRSAAAAGGDVRTIAGLMAVHLYPGPR